MSPHDWRHLADLADQMADLLAAADVTHVDPDTAHNLKTVDTQRLRETALDCRDAAQDVADNLAPVLDAIRDTETQRSAAA